MLRLIYVVLVVLGTGAFPVLSLAAPTPDLSPPPPPPPPPYTLKVSPNPILVPQLPDPTHPMKIAVEWSASVGSTNNLIALYPVGAARTSRPIQFAYTSGERHGRLILEASLTVGITYELRYIRNNQFNKVVATLPIRVELASNFPPMFNVDAPNPAVEASTIDLIAFAIDPDGSISQVEFFVDGRSVGKTTTSVAGDPVRFSVRWPTGSVGRHSLTVTVTDNRGAQATSSPVPILVVPAQPPTGSVTINQGAATTTPQDTVAPTIQTVLPLRITFPHDGVILNPQGALQSILHDDGPSVQGASPIASGGQVGGGNPMALVTAFGDPIGGWLATDTIVIAPWVSLGRRSLKRKILVIGTAEGATRVTVNGVAAILTNGRFEVKDVMIREGDNRLTVTATDTAGRSMTTTVTVTLTSAPLGTPQVPRLNPQLQVDPKGPGGVDRRKLYPGVPITFTLTEIEAARELIQSQFLLDGKLLRDWEADPTLRWTPTENQVGLHTVEVRLRDIFGTQIAKPMRLLVRHQPPAPQ